MSYRVRVNEAGQLVLQVYISPVSTQFSYDREGTWRDAKVEDIPVSSPFRQETYAADAVWNGKT